MPFRTATIEFMIIKVIDMDTPMDAPKSSLCLIPTYIEVINIPMARRNLQLQKLKKFNIISTMDISPIKVRDNIEPNMAKSKETFPHLLSFSS